MSHLRRSCTLKRRSTVSSSRFGSVPWSTQSTLVGTSGFPRWSRTPATPAAWSFDAGLRLCWTSTARREWLRAGVRRPAWRASDFTGTVPGHQSRQALGPGGLIGSDPRHGFAQCFAIGCAGHRWPHSRSGGLAQVASLGHCLEFRSAAGITRDRCDARASDPAECPPGCRCLAPATLVRQLGRRWCDETATPCSPLRRRLRLLQAAAAPAAALGSSHRLRPVALQDAEADTLLRGMDRDRKMASWHLVMPTARSTRAARRCRSCFGCCRTAPVRRHLLGLSRRDRRRLSLGRSQPHRAQPLDALARQLALDE